MGEDKRPKKEVYKEYTVILVENSSLVDSGRYKKPNGDKYANDQRGDAIIYIY